MAPKYKKANIIGYTESFRITAILKFRKLPWRDFFCFFVDLVVFIVFIV